MDAKQCLFCYLYLSMLSLPLTAQEWSKKDSLKLRQLLESDQEIRINKNLIMEIEFELHKPKSFVGFDPTLPQLLPTFKTDQVPTIKKEFISPHNSIFLPNYTWKKFSNNLILQSNSNFSERCNNFHIQTSIEYKLSDKWSLSMYGMQNLDNRRYKGLPLEAMPTTLGTDVSFNMNKYWKIKTGMQYQHNTIKKRWEFIPQISITYEW